MYTFTLGLSQYIFTLKYITVSLNFKNVKTIIKLLKDNIDLYCFKTHDLKPRWVNEFIKESRDNNLDM